MTARIQERIPSAGDKLDAFRAKSSAHALAPSMSPSKKCHSCGQCKSVVGGKNRSLLGGKASIHNPNRFTCKSCLDLRAGLS